MTERTSAERIAAEYDRLKALSLEKNKAYGDTALNPPHIFSALKGSEAIRARLDDKLSRHMHQPGAFGEREIDDIIGYLVLLIIVEREEALRDAPVPADGYRFPSPLAPINTTLVNWEIRS